MTKQRWIIFALLLSIAFNFTFLGAFGYRMWVKHRHRPPYDFWMEGPPPIPGRPGNDEHSKFRMEQRKHFQHMREIFLPGVKKTHEQLFRKRKELADLIMTDKPDTAVINGMLNEISGLQMRIEKDVVRQLLKERELMDPEQRKQFQKFILKRLGDRDRKILHHGYPEKKEDENP